RILLIEYLNLNGQHSKNMLTLISGTSIAQLIPVAISPFLTRIYSPQDFGILGLFIAITSILGYVVNGRYELAIMLPDNDDDALNVLALGLLISSVLSVFLFLFVVIFNEEMAGMLGNTAMSVWLYFAPPVIFFLGTFY
ncbi:translocase, partial [Salinimicrobium sp. CDJ15-91]|nr:translocase [Salinimicrobium oceani]